MGDKGNLRGSLSKTSIQNSGNIANPCCRAAAAGKVVFHSLTNRLKALGHLVSADAVLPVLQPELTAEVLERCPVRHDDDGTHAAAGICTEHNVIVCEFARNCC